MTASQKIDEIKASLGLQDFVEKYDGDLRWKISCLIGKIAEAAEVENALGVVTKAAKADKDAVEKAANDKATETTWPADMGAPR